MFNARLFDMFTCLSVNSSLSSQVQRYSIMCCSMWHDCWEMLVEKSPTFPFSSKFPPAPRNGIDLKIEHLRTSKIEQILLNYHQKIHQGRIYRCSSSLGLELFFPDWIFFIFYIFKFKSCFLTSPPTFPNLNLQTNRTDFWLLPSQIERILLTIFHQKFTQRTGER